MYKYLIIFVLLLAGCKSSRTLEKQENTTEHTDSVTIRDSETTTIHDSLRLHYKVVYDTLGRIIERDITRVQYIDTLHNKYYNKDTVSQQQAKALINHNSSGNNTKILFFIIGLIVVIVIMATILITSISFREYRELWKKKT